MAVARGGMIEVNFLRVTIILIVNILRDLALNVVKDLSTKERVDLYVLLVYAHLKHNDVLNVEMDILLNDLVEPNF